MSIHRNIGWIEIKYGLLWLRTMQLQSPQPFSDKNDQSPQAWKWNEASKKKESNKSILTE